MKRGMMMAAVAGLAMGGAAQAQTLSVEVTFSVDAVSIGDTFTATMAAYFTGHPAGAYLSSINIDVFGAHGWEVSNVASIAWNNPPLGFDGQPTASGADVLGIEAAQFSLIPPVTPGSPLLITTWTVTVTQDAVPELTYTAAVTNDAPYPFSVTGGGFADPAIPFGIDAFSSESIIIPAPGVLGLFGLGGLALARRR